ncbi:hypothetical protein GCM10007301_38910 [Azorhizobium oxalatiphilum]|uniref:Uncharacterized protein n=1 Tax=Azorhizobium oxalatiphilum TaxID=980631 RepID=A0A917C858_9HYPH|nr:hypothetical protein [Azorhizobium oxalatiphilum]GGF75247.1 hypothetical protein GCM10007301_38910 [Azorhizobium oxalatiphilum]
MRLRDRMEQYDGDDYTPATDLVFSLFAMTVLLLAIFGAGSHVKDQNVNGLITLTREDLVATREQSETLQAENAALRARVEQAEARATAVVPAGAQAPKTLVVAEFTRLRRDMSKDGFTPAFIAQVKASLRGAAAEAGRRQANEITIEISARLALDEPEALDEAMIDSLTWSGWLRTALAQTALPAGCILVQPMGGWRAMQIGRIAYEADGAQKIRAIVDGGPEAKKYRTGPSPASSALEEDDRLRIMLRRDETSRCDAAALTKALGLL